MSLTPLALTAVRAAVILGFVLVAVRVLARGSAATRRSLLVGGFAVVLALPIATAVLPALHLRDRAAGADVELLVLQSTPDAVDRVDGAFAPLVELAPNVAPRATAAQPLATGVSPLALVLGVWGLGAALVLSRLGVGLLRARRLVKAARFVETLDIAGRPVEVRISRAVETPAVTGLLVPIVLLPYEAETWTAERRRVVLAHELAHIASHDCLANVIAQLAVAIHWFDPLVWLAARKLRMERELAADDRVLDQGVLASSYAEHLLALASTGGDHPAGVLAMAEPSQVAVRIRALLAPRTRSSLRRTRVVVIGAGLALAAFVACATPDPEPAPAAPAAPAETPVGTTIDLRIQKIADEELDRMTKEWAPCAAIVLVLDPQTGAVVAASHSGGTEPTAQLAASRPITPGSIVKPLVIAAALDEGVIKPTDQFDASPMPLGTIVDDRPHGTLAVGEILAVSSNVGMVKVFDKLGGAKLAQWTKRFHLAAAPATIADGPGGAAYAIGAKVPSTPLEMAAAYAMLANGGVYHAPTFVPARGEGERIVRAETAATVLDLLEGVTGDNGTGKAARVAGIRVAGKTGTAQLGKSPRDVYSSFVGVAPIDHPRYVIFVGAETPRDGGSGGQVAAPVFGRVMTRVLAR